jgi:molybdate transport system regulatory protein
MAKTQVSIRIDLETGGRIGPGKMALLEAISKTESITAAPRSINMSYRRAWLLVDEVNKLLNEPAVTGAAGGVDGGGSTLTPVGQKTIQLYHSIEMRTRAATRREFRAFRKLMRECRGGRWVSRWLSVLLATLSDRGGGTVAAGRMPVSGHGFGSHV